MSYSVGNRLLTHNAHVFKVTPVIKLSVHDTPCSNAMQYIIARDPRVYFLHNLGLIQLTIHEKVNSFAIYTQIKLVLIYAQMKWRGTQAQSKRNSANNAGQVQYNENCLLNYE